MRKNNYTKFADFYDSLMNKDRYKVWKKMINNTIRKYEIKKENALDLACGTGEITNIIKKSGFKKVVGVDISSAMIGIAKKKYPDVRFFIRDITQLGSKGKFHLITSFYDSLNYLISEAKLLKVFKKVNKLLDQDGMFLFDINTKSHIEKAANFDEQILSVKNTQIIFNYSKTKNNFWQIKITGKDKKTQKILWQETHLERGYSENEIKKFLQQAGFKIIDISKEYKYNKINTKYLSRIYFLAQVKKQK